MKNKTIQTKVSPGAILNEVVVGAMRARGISLREWCNQNGVSPTCARQALYGLSGGDRGKALLDEMITAAGPDVVAVAYRQRMQAETASLAEVAA